MAKTDFLKNKTGVTSCSAIVSRLPVVMVVNKENILTSAEQNWIMSLNRPNKQIVLIYICFIVEVLPHWS